MWAGRNDVEFSVPGYTWMGLNCCITSSYVVRGHLALPFVTSSERFTS